MTDRNAPADEPALFCALITPYRSLGGAGFLVLMAAIGGVSRAENSVGSAISMSLRAVIAAKYTCSWRKSPAVLRNGPAKKAP